MTDERSSAAVLESARAVFEREPAPTMATLAAASGLSLRQLYRRFGSRADLLRQLELEPPAGARDRVIIAAFELLGRSSLADLSMDELAVRADVSRATLYRLFPGKSALFRALVTTYSPWEPIARVFDQHAGAADAPPEQVIPHIARAISLALTDRTAVLLRMVFEMSTGEPDTAEGVQHSMTRGLPDLLSYLERQMAAGRLRRVHPVLALQLLAGPLVAHEMTRSLAALLDFTESHEQVVGEVVSFWLRAMEPGDHSG